MKSGRQKKQRATTKVISTSVLIRKTINCLGYYTKGDTIMLHKNDFAIEQLENRLETLCIYVPYIATCYKTVWFVRIPYPCVKYYRFCF